MDILGFGIVGVIVFILAVVGVGGFIWFKSRYKVASSNEALIITGPGISSKSGNDRNVFEDDNGRSLKIIRGGGYRLRMFQNAEKVNLTSFQLQVNSGNSYTKEGIQIQVESVAVVSIGSDLSIMANFAEKFLGKSDQEKEHEITKVLEGHLRSIVASLEIEKIYNDFKEVNNQVKNIAEEDLKGMGFEITSFSLNDVKDTDELGFITSLGRPHLADVRKKADIAEADSKRETEIHIAKTQEETEKEKYNREISIAESRKEKELKEAAFKKETEKARAEEEASYELSKAQQAKNVQQENLSLQREKKQEELDISHYERKQAVEIEKEEANVRKAKADADYYDQKRKAEAEAVKLKSQGEAEASNRKKQGEAEAEIVREQGRAEADSIREKGKAEAEALEAKAKAFEQFGEAAIADMMIKVLPELAKAVSEPMSNVDSIKILDGGNGKGMNGLQGSVMGQMASIQESLKDATGMDLAEIINNYSGKNNYKGELSEIADRLPEKEKKEDEVDEEVKFETFDEDVYDAEDNSGGSVEE